MYVFALSCTVVTANARRRNQTSQGKSRVLGHWVRFIDKYIPNFYPG